MDRKPLPPPFAKGTRVRYVGTRRSSVEAADGSLIPYMHPGLIVTVDRVHPGTRGTLMELPRDWDDDEPPLDRTTDGYSTYTIPVPGRKNFGRIIWPKDAAEWEVMKD